MKLRTFFLGLLGTGILVGCADSGTVSTQVVRPKRVILMIDNSKSAVKLIPTTYQPIAARFAAGVEDLGTTWSIYTFVNTPRLVVPDFRVTDCMQFGRIFSDHFTTDAASSERGTYYAPMLAKAVDLVESDPDVDFTVVVLSDGGIDDKDRNKLDRVAMRLATQRNLTGLFIGEINNPKAREDVQNALAAFDVQHKLFIANAYDRGQQLEGTLAAFKGGRR